jgi:hypothetical protein
MALPQTFFPSHPPVESPRQRATSLSSSPTRSR